MVVQKRLNGGIMVVHDIGPIQDAGNFTDGGPTQVFPLCITTGIQHNILKCLLDRLGAYAIRSDTLICSLWSIYCMSYTTQVYLVTQALLRVASSEHFNSANNNYEMILEHRSRIWRVDGASTAQPAPTSQHKRGTTAGLRVSAATPGGGSSGSGSLQHNSSIRMPTSKRAKRDESKVYLHSKKYIYRQVKKLCHHLTIIKNDY